MLIEIIGWLGSFMVIFAYAMNIFKKMSADSFSYYLLNIMGSVFLIVNTFYHHAIPSVAVNIIWVLIALSALLKKKDISHRANGEKE
jgi:predicted membrane protein